MDYFDFYVFGLQVVKVRILGWELFQNVSTRSFPRALTGLVTVPITGFRPFLDLQVVLLLPDLVPRECCIL